MLDRIGKKLGYKDKGFTIIEVMIVLAVAGLIMAIVLIAIPQLQRSQRNTARKNIMGRISTEMNTYAGNNSGRIPVDQGDIDDVVARYLNGININDPQEDAPMDITYKAAPANGVPTGADLPVVGSINYATDKTCDGESIANGSSRQFAMWTQLEGGSVFCVDNQ